MIDCRWTKYVEAWFDGEPARARGVEAHLAECPKCAQRLEQLERVREGVIASRRRETISDNQFSAFMAGIRDGLEEAPAPGRRRFWPAFSLAAAALLIALATFLILDTGPAPVRATEVESVSTDLEGAIVGFAVEDGVTTVWVNDFGKDID
jgi:anti-sigma factor RsiW